MKVQEGLLDFSGCISCIYGLPVANDKEDDEEFEPEIGWDVVVYRGFECANGTE